MYVNPGAGYMLLSIDFGARLSLSCTVAPLQLPTTLPWALPNRSSRCDDTRKRAVFYFAMRRHTIGAHGTG
jgi:hypothetical protein